MLELQLLNDKLDLLLKKYAAIQSENKRLKEAVGQQTRKIESLNTKLADLEHNMVAVQIGSNVLNEEEKLHMRKQVDHVIGEIDKILKTLND